MRAAAVLSLVLAYRVGARLAGPAAGAVAALSLALSADLYRTALLGSAEPVLIALTLGAVDRHLAGRRDWALVLVALAGLIRPEAWVLLGLYGAYVWLREPHLRPLAIAAVVLAPRCGSAWTGSARAIRCTPVRPRRRPPGQRGERQRARLRGRAPRGRRGHPAHARARGGRGRGRGATPRPRGVVAGRARAGLDRGGGDHGRGRLHRHPALPGRARGGPVRPGRRGVRWLLDAVAERRTRVAVACAIGVLALVPALLRARETPACSRRAQPGRPARRAAPRRGPGRRARGGPAPRATGDQPWLQTTLAWELDVPLLGVQATWASSKRHPHWAPPALVFRAPARLAGPRPALPAGVTAATVARSGRWRVLRAGA